VAVDQKHLIGKAFIVNIAAEVESDLQTERKLTQAYDVSSKTFTRSSQGSVAI
jgi:hypothetical protein